MEPWIIGENHTNKLALLSKGTVFHLIHFITHTLVRHGVRYLDARILVVGSRNCYQSTSPRLIQQVTYLELRHDIIHRRGLFHFIIYNSTTSCEQCQEHQAHRSQQPTVTRTNVLTQGSHMRVTFRHRTKTPLENFPIRPS